MDSAELELLKKDLCIEADPAAASRFRTAAAHLEGLDLDTVARPPAATEAARLLVGLALAGASDELRELLVPDPAVSENRWTVACFQVGDLTPVSIQDFDDPTEAVVTVAACPDSVHVGAELVASNDRGLRWTALWRTEDHVSFQLPTADTAETGEETEDGDLSPELLGALDRWRARLCEWSGRDGAILPADLQQTREPEPALPLQLHFPGFSPPRAHTPHAGLEAPSRRAVAQLHALEQRLTHIESTVREISAGLQTFAEDAEHRDDVSSEAVEYAIDVRFQVLSRVVQAALDRLGAQLVEEMKQRVPADSDDENGSNVIDMRG